MLKRDPRDRRYQERLAGSTLVSLLFHVLLALALFSVVAHSAQEGATESQIGGSIVTLEARAPVVARVPVRAEQAAPVPHAPRIAPPQHALAARPAHQPQPPARHELSKFAPTAPPNPTPLPQATPQPNVEPTRAVIEPSPAMELPAVPTSVPTAVAVAVVVKVPPTAAPSPVPTTARTARPSSRPVPAASPTARPETPAPAAMKSTASPHPSPAAIARASASPSAKPGVPSPSPTQGAPGSKGIASPGPRAGNSAAERPGPQRPVAVNPAPSNAPASQAPRSKSRANASDINDKLRGLLPNNPVNPTQGSYHPAVSLNGSMEPTPPPDVIAVTKFIYEERGSGSDALERMWVTNVHKEGAFTMCDGWLVRYAQTSQPAAQIGTATNPISGGIRIGIPVGGAARGGLGRAIVEAHASVVCSARHLVPFAPSATPSP